jgi:hypothetical protein
MPTEEQDIRFYTVEIGRNLPLSEQLHEANAQICFEAAGDEKVLLEEIGFRSGYRVLRYRLWRNKEINK